MKQKPSFTVTSARRPVWQRLTPAAWVVVGVLAVVLLLVLGGGGAALLAQFGGEEVWDPTPSPTAAMTPTVTEAGPIPVPTHWWESTTTPPAEITPAFPAWWSAEMIQDEDGNWQPPQEVVDMARAHIEEAADGQVQIYLASDPPDLDRYAQMQPLWYSGSFLQWEEGEYLGGMREGRYLYSAAQWESCLRQLQDWSEGGLECTMGSACQNGTAYSYDFAQGQGSETPLAASGLILLRLRYDPTDGRWKIHQFLDYVPPEGE